MVSTNWIRYASGRWCELTTLNLQDPHFNSLKGVYVIWHGGANPAVVRVGQGLISERLAEHRNDRGILTYRSFGLYVTWTAIPVALLDGVERFLAEKWRPKIGDRFPNAIPVAVTSPW